jgi:hypothetical protein
MVAITLATAKSGAATAETSGEEVTLVHDDDVIQFLEGSDELTSEPGDESSSYGFNKTPYSSDESQTYFSEIGKMAHSNTWVEDRPRLLKENAKKCSSCIKCQGKIFSLY